MKVEVVDLKGVKLSVEFLFPSRDAATRFLKNLDTRFTNAVHSGPEHA